MVWVFGLHRARVGRSVRITTTSTPVDGSGARAAAGMDGTEYMQRHLWSPMGSVRGRLMEPGQHGQRLREDGERCQCRRHGLRSVRVSLRSRRPRRRTSGVAGASVAEDTSGDPSPGYQCWWWVDTERPGRFFARGNLGQSIYVDPRTDVVIVRTRADFGIDTWRELLRAVAGKAAAAPFGP
jgi:CubicO group peptidase (beta-lactamase class C family)